MALTTAGFQGPVTEGQEALRWALSSPIVTRNSSTEFNVTAGSGRAVTVSAGSILVCGVAVTNTAAASVTIPASTTARRNVIALRVTWAGATSRVELVCLQGPTGGTSYPTLTQNVGSVYEAPLAMVYTAANFSTVTNSSIYATAPTGGRGGTLVLPSATHIAIAPAQDGSTLEVQDTGARWQRKGTTWVQISDNGTSWRYFDPILKFQGAGNFQPGTVNLGNGGTRKGRFKVIDGWLHGDIEIRQGTSGANYGAGPMTIDLPPGFAPDAYFVDRWMNGHCYTTPEEQMDWMTQGLIRSNENYLRLWAYRRASDCRMLPMQNSDGTGNSGTGIPLIGTSWTSPQVITMQLLYSLGG